LRLSLSKSVQELKKVDKQIKLKEFALQVFLDMVEEGKKKLSKATKEYTKFKANYERFGNNVTCKLLDYWFGATNPLNGN
jgi:hypothetical protein